ncbi:MAG: hypothetical protein GX986_06510 [Firmicutes bacterium]|nr:hypothetical protein [Bacillota bacterium]
MTSGLPSQEPFYYEDEIELREIIEIIRKRIWLVVLLPLVAALVAFGVSKYVIVPEYEASTQIALGTFGHEIYGNLAASKEILVSRDMLSQVLVDLRLTDEYRSTEDFAGPLSIEEVRGTRMLSIKYQHSDAARAKAVVEAVAARFLEQSNAIYAQKHELPAERLAKLQDEYAGTLDAYQDSLDTLVALEAMESSDAAILIARARVLDHLAADRSILLSLGEEIHTTEMALISMESTVVTDQPAVGIDPVNVRPMLNVAIALVLGGMVALGIVFVQEYFEKNPLESR